MLEPRDVVTNILIGLVLMGVPVTFLLHNIFRMI